MKAAAALAACALLAACATASSVSNAPGGGYLPAGQLDQLASAAPLPGPDAAAEAFPGGPGTDRWWLATAHAELRPPEAAQHFDCVLGTRLAEAPRPALTRLMTRLLADADALTRAMADRAPRPRPIMLIEGLQPCQRVNDAARISPSWPAGGAVAGAAYGELFAALAPDRAREARRMGREIGVSRAVCRMNWPSDVRDGAAAGRSLYTAIASDPLFNEDLAAARAEVLAARAEGLTNPSCAAERLALRDAGD